MERQKISSGAAWEEEVGYSRAIRIGDRILVAGTTGILSDGQPASTDAYSQAMRALEIVERALVEAGSGMSDVVRTRMYVVDVPINSKEAMRAHGEVFGEIRPVATLVGVSALVRPDLLVEIEVEAVVG